MANVRLDISQLRTFSRKVSEFKRTERDAMHQECLNTMAAEYLRVAKLNTPVSGGQEYDVSEKAYENIAAYEVTGKGYHIAKSRNRGGRTKQLKRIMRGKDGKRYRVLTASEHMRRSWEVGEMAKRRGNYSIPVINSASYASFVNDGHRQTPGRFVPVLGKRLVKNWVEGLHMAEKAEASVRKKSNRIMQRIVDTHMKGGLE